MCAVPSVRVSARDKVPRTTITSAEFVLCVCERERWRVNVCERVSVCECVCVYLCVCVCVCLPESDKVPRTTITSAACALWVCMCVCEGVSQ